MVAFVFNIQGVQVEQIQIRINPDGSITPETSFLVFDGEKYVLAADFSGSLIIEKRHAVVDGAGHVIQGYGEENGVLIANTSYVTLRNINVKGFTYGIHLKSSYKCVITGCNTTENGLDGLKLETSYGNFILKNAITNNGDDGVQLFKSGNNSVSGNRIFGNDVGIQVNGEKVSSENNTIEGNFIENHWKSIMLGRGSAYTKVVYNTLKESYSEGDSRGCGLELFKSQGNVIHHNNFIQNDNNVLSSSELGADVWDDGAEGNYWSNYAGEDADGDGVGDTPHSEYNYYESETLYFDYPLMSQINIEGLEFRPPEFQFLEPQPDAQSSPDPQIGTQPPSVNELMWIGLAAEAFIILALAAGIVIIFKSSRRKKSFAGEECSGSELTRLPDRL